MYKYLSIDSLFHQLLQELWVSIVNVCHCLILFNVNLSCLSITCRPLLKNRRDWFGFKQLSEDFASYTLILQDRCAFLMMLWLSFHFFPRFDEPKTKFSIPPAVPSCIVARAHNSTQKHYLCDMAFMTHMIFVRYLIIH